MCSSQSSWTTFLGATLNTLIKLKKMKELALIFVNGKLCVNPEIVIEYIREQKNKLSQLKATDVQMANELDEVDLEKIYRGCINTLATHCVIFVSSSENAKIKAYLEMKEYKGTIILCDDEWTFHYENGSGILSLIALSYPLMFQMFYVANHTTCMVMQ